MKDLIVKSFSLNIRTMQLCALYPPDNYNFLFRMKTFFYYMICVVLIPVLGYLKLVLNPLSIKRISESVFMVAELGCFIPKLWPFVGNPERLKRCLHYFDHPSFTVTQPRQKKILEDCIVLCNRTTICFCSLVASGYISWSLRPISWEGHKFPTDIWLPFDPETVPWFYNFFVYIFLLVTTAYAVVLCAVIDPLVGLLPYQATCQIKILKDNLQHLGLYTKQEIAKQNLNPEEEILKTNEIISDKINHCVRHHEAILRFVKEYENCFAQYLFSQFLGSIVVICITILQLSIVEPFSLDFFAMMMYFFAVVTEIYIFSYFGTQLHEESITIPDAIYLGNWYEYDMKTKRSLIILMERTKRPIKVTAGKIFDMSLVTFVTIMRRSYSLLAVLESFDSGGK